MIPYSRQLITKKECAQINKILLSNYLTQGPMVPKFEKKISKYCGSKFTVAVNSGTSALHIACLALNIDVNDIVWTSAISFVASANCAAYCGAKVEFLDIDIKTFNISIDFFENKLKIAKKKNKLPKAIILVHLGGLACDLKRINKLRKKYKFKIIEDASHAIGSTYHETKIGDCKYSDIAVFSFHAVKTITTCEGGAATTNNKNIYNKLLIYREHGIVRQNQSKFKNKRPKYYNQIRLGYNYRMNDVEATLGLMQLKKINKWIKYKNFLANRYRLAFKELPLKYQLIPKNYYSSYHLYIILIKSRKYSRDQVLKKLIKKGIGCNIHYMPIYKHNYYKKRSNNNKFPASEVYYRNCISIPIYAGLTVKKQNKVIKLLKDVLN